MSDKPQPITNLSSIDETTCANTRQNHTTAWWQTHSMTKCVSELSEPSKYLNCQRHTLRAELFAELVLIDGGGPTCVCRPDTSVKSKGPNAFPDDSADWQGILARPSAMVQFRMFSFSLARILVLLYSIVTVIAFISCWRTPAKLNFRKIWVPGKRNSVQNITCEYK